MFEDGKRDRRERRRQRRAGLRRGSRDLGRTGERWKIYIGQVRYQKVKVPPERSIYLGRSFFEVRSLAELNALLRFFRALQFIPIVE
jgi:transposase